VSLHSPTQVTVEATTLSDNDAFGTGATGGDLFVDECPGAVISGGSAADNTAIHAGGGLDVERCNSVSISGAAFFREYSDRSRAGVGVAWRVRRRITMPFPD
jgi:hypothetical protein